MEIVAPVPEILHEPERDSSVAYEQVSLRGLGKSQCIPVKKRQSRVTVHIHPSECISCQRYAQREVGIRYEIPALDITGSAA